MIIVLPLMVITIQQALSVYQWLQPANAQSQQSNNTFILWRINYVLPNEKVEVSIADIDDIWTYKITIPEKLKIHPYNFLIHYYDHTVNIPTKLNENEMVIMCVRPLQQLAAGSQYTETFVTNNMARGILYYNFQEYVPPADPNLSQY